MSRYDHGKLFVGNLPKDIRTREVEDIFYKFGRIRSIDIRGYSTGSPYAFIEFSHSRDARDAITSRDGYDFDGYRLKVEYQKGSRRFRDRYDDRYDRYDDRGRRSLPPRRTNYRVKISNLPPSGSWQDVKDHVRKVGEVAYANVFNDGTGVIEFFREEDMHRVVRELDGSRFKSHENETSTIYLKIQGESYGGSRSRSRSRSRSYSRSDSRSVSRSYSRSDSRSRSRSYSKSHSRSISKSRSRSHSRSHSKSHSKSHSRSQSRSQSRSRSKSIENRNSEFNDSKEIETKSIENKDNNLKDDNEQEMKSPSNN